MLYLTCEKSICDRTYALVIDDVATCEGIACTSIHFATCVSVGNSCMPRHRRPFQYPMRWLIVRFYKVTEPPWVEVTKTPCVNFSVRVIINLTKVPVRMFESQPYLTGVTAVFAIMKNWENNAPNEIGLVTPTPQICVKNCPIPRSPIAQLWLCLSNLKGSDNPSRPRQNVRHFADDTFNRIYLNENFRVSIKISLKFVPKGSIYNIPVLVQIMAWRRPGDKPLSETMMVSLLTHISVTRPQWVNLNCWLIGLVYFKIRRLNTDWNGPRTLNLGKTHVALQMIPQHNTNACVFVQPVNFLFTSILPILS